MSREDYVDCLQRKMLALETSSQHTHTQTVWKMNTNLVELSLRVQLQFHLSQTLVQHSSHLLCMQQQGGERDVQLL